MRLDSRTPWLSALAVVQVSLFLHYYEQWIGPFPPIGEAQSALLLRIYQMSQFAQSAGLAEAWRMSSATYDAVTPFSVVGTLLEIYVGAGRLPLLLPSLILSVVLEISVAAAAFRLTRRPVLAAAGVGLLLLLNRPWLPGGGLFEVGPGFTAYCAFGIVVVWLANRPGRLRPAVLLSCLAMSILCLPAGLGLFGCALGACGLRLLFDHTRDRTVLWVAATVVILVLAVASVAVPPSCEPDLAVTSSLAEAVAGHCTLRLTTSLDAAASYAIGLKFAIAAFTVGLLAVFAGLRFWREGRRPSDAQLVRVNARGLAFDVGLLCLVILVQCLRRSVDPVGAGFLDLPLVMALVSALGLVAGGEPQRDRSVAQEIVPSVVSGHSAEAADRAKSPKDAGKMRPDRPGIVVAVVCWGLLAMGLLIQWSNAVFGPLSAPSFSARAGYAEVARWMTRDAFENERRTVKVLFVPDRPDMLSSSLTAFTYELFGQIITVEKLSSGALSDAPADGPATPDPNYTIWTDRLAGDDASPEASAENALIGRLRKVDLTRIRVPAGSAMVEILSGPNVRLAGVSGGWLTAQDISVSFDPIALKNPTTLVMSGPDNYARYVPEVPTVTATVGATGGPVVTVPARFTRGPAGYRISIDLAGLRSVGGREITIHLAFDRFFVPRDIGMNPDPRRLVVLEPTAIGFAAAASASEAPRATP